MESGSGGGDGKRPDHEKPANDNWPRDKLDDVKKADTSERLAAPVLFIARLIGRRVAREDYEALQAANDNRKPVDMRDEEGDKDEDA